MLISLFSQIKSKDLKKSIDYDSPVIYKVLNFVIGTTPRMMQFIYEIFYCHSILL